MTFEEALILNTNDFVIITKNTQRFPKGIYRVLKHWNADLNRCVATSSGRGMRKIVWIALKNLNGLDKGLDTIAFRLEISNEYIEKFTGNKKSLSILYGDKNVSY